MVPLLFELKNVYKEYQIADKKRPVLNIPFLQIERGISCILGISGEGKSTLLNVLGLLDEPDKTHSSEITYFFSTGEKLEYRQLWKRGIEFWKFWKKGAVEFRRKEIGFLYQEAHLYGHLTAVDNVALSYQMGNLCGTKEAREKAKECLKELSLVDEERGDRSFSFPEELSGGERQRVALARAIIKKPNLLCCDEPTGNLDSINKDLVIKTFQSIREKNPNTSILIVTHDVEMAIHIADFVFVMKKGNAQRIEKPWDQDKITTFMQSKRA